MRMTGASDFARTRHDTAIHQFQSYVGDPLATIDEALADSPAFVAGHLLKAAALYTLCERQYVPMAAESLASAKRYETSANARERGMIAALDALVGGQWKRGAQLLDHVLIDEPRDVLALQVGHLMDFYRGDALNLRNRIARVLPSWDASVPGYSYVLGMHAFGLEEMNQYTEAEETAWRALELQPKDGWAVHAAVHVMEMQGRIDEGVEILTSRESDWAPDNAFAFHNFWHLALFHMDGARYDRALGLFDSALQPGPVPLILTLIDRTALLWRLRLEGVDVGKRFEPVADEWEGRLEGEAGFYAFNDTHAAMAFVATDRGVALDRLMARMLEAVADENANAAMTRDVGLPLVEGLAKFGRGHYPAAIEAIESMRDGASRFGGSHAQRDVITLTLIEAALRNGDDARARHYIAERLVQKPKGEWGRRLARRAAVALS